MRNNDEVSGSVNPETGPALCRTSSAASFVPPNAANQASYNYSMVPPQFNHPHNPQAHYYNQPYMYIQQAPPALQQPHWGVHADPSQFYQSGVTCYRTGNAAAPFIYWPNHQFGGVGVAPSPSSKSMFPGYSQPPSDTSIYRHAAEQNLSSEHHSLIPNETPSEPAASASSAVGRRDDVEDDRPAVSSSTPGFSAPAYSHHSTAVIDPSATSLAAATFALTAVAAAAPFVTTSVAYPEDDHRSEVVDPAAKEPATTSSNTSYVSENQSNLTTGQTNTNRLKRALDENAIRDENHARTSNIRRRNIEQAAMLEHARGQLVATRGLEAKAAIAARLPFQSQSGRATPPLPSKSSIAAPASSLHEQPVDHAHSRETFFDSLTTAAATSSSREGSSLAQVGIVRSSSSTSKDKHRSAGLAPVSAAERAEARAAVEAVLVLWHSCGGSSNNSNGKPSPTKPGNLPAANCGSGSGTSAPGVVRSMRRSTIDYVDDDDDDDAVVLAPWRKLFFEEAVCRMPSTRFRFFPAQQVQAPGNGPARRLNGIRALAADAASLATSCAALPFRYGQRRTGVPPKSGSNTANTSRLSTVTSGTAANFSQQANLHSPEHLSVPTDSTSHGSESTTSVGNANTCPTLVLLPELEGRAVVVRQRCSVPTPVEGAAAKAEGGRPLPQGHEASEELVLQCAWVVRTTNAVACGAAHEVSQRGMLRCTLRRALGHTRHHLEPWAAADGDLSTGSAESATETMRSSHGRNNSCNSGNSSNSDSHDDGGSSSPSKDPRVTTPPLVAAVASPAGRSASMQDSAPPPLKVFAMDVVFDPWYWTRALGEAFGLPGGLPLQPNTAAAALASTNASGSSSRRRRGSSGNSGGSSVRRKDCGSGNEAADSHRSTSSSSSSNTSEYSSGSDLSRSHRQQNAHAAACADAAAYTSMVRSEPLPATPAPSSAINPSSESLSSGAVGRRGGVLRLVCRAVPPFEVVSICQDFKAAIMAAGGVDSSSLIGQPPPWLLAQQPRSGISGGQTPPVQQSPHCLTPSKRIREDPTCSSEMASHDPPRHEINHEAWRVTSGVHGDIAEPELDNTPPLSTWTEADCETIKQMMLRVAVSRRPCYCPQIPLNLCSYDGSRSSSRTAGGSGTSNETALYFAEMFPLDDENGEQLEGLEMTEPKSRNGSCGDLSVDNHPAPLVLWQLSQARSTTPEAPEHVHQDGGSGGTRDQGQPPAANLGAETAIIPSQISTLHAPANYSSTECRVHNDHQGGPRGSEGCGGRSAASSSRGSSGHVAGQRGGSAPPPPRLSGGVRLGGSPLGTGTAGPPSVQPGSSSYRGPPPTQPRNPHWNPLSSPLTPITRPYTMNTQADPEESHGTGASKSKPDTATAEAATTATVASSKSSEATSAASTEGMGPIWV